MLQKTIIIVGCIIFLLGLLLFGYLGIFNRYYADDWCYNADFKSLGLLGTIKGYTYITTYASNRYSLTFLSGILYKMGILGVQVMTPFVITFWLIGMYVNLENILKTTRFSRTSPFIFLISAIILQFTLYVAPHSYQNLYWRSGLLPYTAPLVTVVWVFGFITHQIETGRSAKVNKVITIVLIFLGGGFSEAANAYISTALGLYVVFTIIALRKNNSWANDSLSTSIIYFASSLLALFVLLISPANEPRRLASYGNPAPIHELPFLVFSLGFDFVEYFFESLPLPSIMLFVTVALLAFILNPEDTEPLNTREFITWSLIVIVVAFVLISSSQAPSAYIEKGPPAPRIQIIPRFTIVLALSALAWLLGYFLHDKVKKKWTVLFAIMILLFTYGYAGRSIFITSKKIELYANRAEIWDKRNGNIYQAKEKGRLEVDVKGIDGAPVGGLKDFKPEASDWVNQCAARFYGVNAIRATLP
jgi:hypothetical protein